MDKFKNGIPSKIRLEACNMCQLDCPLCETPRRRTRPGIKGWGYLKFEDYKTLLEKNPSIKEVDLAWLGEIFLNPDIRKIIRYSFEKRIVLRANGGVNLNNVSEDILRDLVKYRFASLSVAIDGVSQRTYAKYRRKGHLSKVLRNIMTINKYKKLLGSPFPVLIWQFIVFGHNEHEIPKAQRLAEKLGMSFYTKMSWDENYSPVKNKEFVRRVTGQDSTSRKEYADKHGKDYQDDLCRQLWEEPAINWDGKLFGCCKNTWMSFGNVFESGLEAALNGKKYQYMKDMVSGKKPPKKSIVCLSCPVFQNRKDT